MPQIAVYNAPDQGLRPSEIGIDATAAAARRVGAAYSEAAQLTKDTGARIGGAIKSIGDQATDFITNNQKSLGSAAFAGMSNQYAQEWHDINKTANPNDPTVAQNFMQRLEGDLQKFKSGFFTEAGQQWAESQIDGFRKHMYQKTTADRTAAAGHAAVVNADTAKTGNANSAYWDGTENGTRDAVNRWKASGLPKDVIEAGIPDIVGKGALGAIKANAQVPEWIKKDEFKPYVDAEKLQKAADQQVTANNQAEKRTRSTNEYALKQQWNTEADKIYRDTLPVNNSSRPQLPQDINERVAKLQPSEDAPPALHTAYQKLVNHVNAIQDRLNKPEPLAALSARTAADVVTRIHNGEITDESEITDLFGKGLLNSRHYNFARKEFEELRTDEGVRLTTQKADVFRSVRNMITKSNPLMGTMDQSGDAQFLRFKEDVAAKIAEYRAAHKDPHDLLNPQKPDFVGTAASLAPYQKPLDESMRETVNRLNPARPGAPAAAPPAATPAPTPAPVPNPKLRRPGETPEQYDARVNARVPRPPATAPVPGAI